MELEGFVPGISPHTLTEVNEHFAVALSHVLGHGQDAGHVVVEEGILLLETSREEGLNSEFLFL